MRRNEIERIIDIATRILEAKEVSLPDLNRERLIPISRDDYEYIKPLLNGRCKFTFQIGKVELSSAQIMAQSTILINGDAFIASEEPQRFRWLLYTAVNTLSMMYRRVKYSDLVEADEENTIKFA